MEEYTYKVTVVWEGGRVEANNKKEAREKIKALFKGDYNLNLFNNEITQIHKF